MGNQKFEKRKPFILAKATGTILLVFAILLYAAAEIVHCLHTIIEILVTLAKRSEDMAK